MDVVAEARRFARTLVREFGFFQTHYEDTDATHGETHALIELKRAGELEGGELARLLNIKKSGASKLLTKLLKKGWIEQSRTVDGRKKLSRLTPVGRAKVEEVEALAHDRVGRALGLLSKDEALTVLKGLQLLAFSLKSSRARQQYLIRPCEPRDDQQIASIVRRALKDLGFEGPGTAAGDVSLDSLSSFNGYRQCYLIAEIDGRVMGGAGIAPMEGESKEVCELIRMFLRPEARCSGLAQLLMDSALEEARRFNYQICYLETTNRMKAAQRLYQRNGFKLTSNRRGNTGHYRCDILMERRL